MSFWSAAYFHLFRGKGEWGQPPPEPSFADFKARLDVVIAEYPTSADSIPPDPDLTEQQWTALNEYYRWKQQVTSWHVERNAPVGIWMSGEDSLAGEQRRWATRVYKAFVGDEWNRQMRAWEQRRSDIIYSRRYTTARIVGALATLMLALLPVLSVVDFTCVAMSDSYKGVLWSDRGVQDVRGFAEQVIWVIPWKAHNGLLEEREMTSTERRAHTDDVIVLGAFLFFPIAWCIGPICFFRTLWSAWEIGYEADKELTRHCFTEQDREAMNKEIDAAIKRMFGWSVLAAWLWWVPVTVAAAVGFFIFLIVFGVVATVTHSVKRGVTGRD
jgi:hypothetical protein